MKIEDLRIGNFILNSNSEIVKVEGVKVRANRVYYEYENSHDWFGEVSEFQSIPLTADWLEKFGFHSDRQWWSFQDWNVDLYTKSQGGYRVQVDAEILCDIAYVHELQNLFHALTGKELEVQDD